MIHDSGQTFQLTRELRGILDAVERAIGDEMSAVRAEGLAVRSPQADGFSLIATEA